MNAVYYFWVCVLIAVCIIKVHSDLNDVAALVAASKQIISEFGNYEDPRNNDAYFENMTSDIPIEYGNFDFVIVGGGTAGLVLANRLTAAEYTVLVIEAGSIDPDVTAILGWFLYFTVANRYSWGYTSTPQENACLATNGTCAYSRGKVLGGSSSTNAGMYVRGNPRDYDIWEELGNTGWSYDQILPYFKKSETARFKNFIDYQYHGFNGIQDIDVPKDVPEITEALLNAHYEVGLKELDYNGYQQLGYSKTQVYLSKNIRSGSNYTYLSNIVNPSKLNITLESLVTNVNIENGKAVGVKFIKNGQYYTATALKEVILSAGTIGTPQILMLSGIGPASELRNLGIEVVADLPVGKYFQDHMFFNAIQYRSDKIIFNTSLEELVELWTRNNGPLITPCQSMAFLDTDNDTVPEIEIFSSILQDVDQYYNINSSYFGVTVSLLHPLSVGELTLASASPRDYPLINPNFLSKNEDFETIYKGIEFILSLNNTKAFRDINLNLAVTSSTACDQANENLSKEWWICNIKEYAISGFHPIGTARMGPNSKNSVVDSNLKVYEVQNLRVVDASIMPTINSGHTNAPVVMIAEKIADGIIMEHSL